MNSERNTDLRCQKLLYNPKDVQYAFCLVPEVCVPPKEPGGGCILPEVGLSLPKPSGDQFDQETKTLNNYDVIIYSWTGISH